MLRLAPLVAAVLLLPALARAATYDIDPAHTNTEFKVRHMMISWVRGQFQKVGGTIEYDPRHVQATRIDATIQTGTVDTRNGMRDNDLKSPKFFDVQKYPTMTFVSTKAVRAGKDKLKVTGKLTIRGVTKTVVLDVTGPTAEVQDPWGNTRIGASATTTIDRRDFGLVWNQALEAGGVLVGDKVMISLDVEATKAKAVNAAAPGKK